jgi:shikimate dehydrogenase
MISQNEMRTYCIIGDPVSNSLSPAMHNAAFNTLNLNCAYIAFRVPKDELEESILSLRATKIAGFNVTIPHKVNIIRLIDELDDSAKKAKAVNTVTNVNGIFKGYNTDVYGFIQPLHRRKIRFNGMEILLLGAGGAARAVVAALSSQEGISKVILSNRNSSRAKELKQIASDLGIQNCETVEFDTIKNVALKSDMIINTTPVGSNDEESIIDYEHIRKDSLVYDVVYKPVLTNLLEHAKYAGAQLVYGYEMLLEQGSKAFEIWTGKVPPVDSMKKALFGVFGPENL